MGVFADLIGVSNPKRIFTFFNQKDICRAAGFSHFLRESNRAVPAWLSQFAEMAKSEKKQQQEHHETFDIEAKFKYPQRPFTDEELSA